MPTRFSAAFALLALVAVALGFYTVGILTGVVTLVGYASATKAQSGAVSTSTWSMSFGVPVVWLSAQQAIRADFDVDARFGAVTLTVAPPLPLRTSLQAATAYVEGTRTGSVVFVGEAPGWYTFSAEPSPLGGPRCGTPGLSLRGILAGNPDCPTYDVRYSVTWHLAQGQAHAVARVSVPRPNGQLAVVRIRD